MVPADDFWKPYEKKISTLDDFLDVVVKTPSRRKEQTPGNWAWRGVHKADWGLHSSIARRLFGKNDQWPEELHIVEAEQKILMKLHEWSLHHGSRGRLSALEQFSLVQHYGGPTRLLDVSFSPLVATWFAVENESDDGKKYAKEDGRLFAIDVTGRMIGRGGNFPTWDTDEGLPWARDPAPDDSVGVVTKVANDPRDAALDDWTRFVYAWRPPRFDPRISAQNAAFLLGGAPSAGAGNKPVQWKKASRGPDSKRYWSIDDVRTFTSLIVRPNVFDKKRRTPDAEQPFYVFRIEAKVKKALRAYLTALGMGALVLFPDYQGFGKFADGMLA